MVPERGSILPENSERVEKTYRSPFGAGEELVRQKRIESEGIGGLELILGGVVVGPFICAGTIVAIDWVLKNSERIISIFNPAK